MKYLLTRFTLTPYTEDNSDILIALLGEIGYDSFTTDDDSETIGYILAKEYHEEKVIEQLNNFPFPDVKITYNTSEAEDKNWNEEWEKNYFQPIIIGNECVVHSTFHKEVPKAKYDIIINPQMAFGTGHHQTTALIMQELLKMDLKDKHILDMGCGTSILSILAAKRGAKKVTGIDIDDWCINNSKDNILLNQVDNIEVKLGDASLLAQEGPFDIIIANINKNILLNDLPKYVARLNPKGAIYLSGFYVDDVDDLRQKITALGLTFVYYKENENWATMKCVASSTIAKH